MKLRHKVGLAPMLIYLAFVGGSSAVNQNPAPGSVWTWFGPTFGADWSQQVTIFPTSPPAYGAKGDGMSVDTAAVQACLNAAQDGGTCLISPKARHNLTGGITIPRAATLDCGLHSPTDLTPPMMASTGFGPALLLDATHPITFADTSGRIRNCLIVPVGMTFPQASASGWTGTAIDTNGKVNPQIVNTTIVGFDTCINTNTNGGSQRAYIYHVYADCNGVANRGSVIAGNNGDIATLTDVKLQVLGTSVACPNRLRAGTGLKLVGLAFVDNLVVQDFEVADVNIESTAGIFMGRVWLDFDVNDGCARGSSIGMFVSNVEDLDIEHLDVNGVQNGIQIAGQNGVRSVHIHDLWLNTIGLDGVVLGLPSGGASAESGGVVKIDMIRTNQSPGK